MDETDDFLRMKSASLILLSNPKVDGLRNSPKEMPGFDSAGFFPAALSPSPSLGPASAVVEKYSGLGASVPGETSDAGLRGDLGDSMVACHPVQVNRSGFETSVLGRASKRGAERSQGVREQ